jgi:uncharacterized surface protein with fasciclin (FAS1) repeats
MKCIRISPSTLAATAMSVVLAGGALASQASALPGQSPSPSAPGSASPSTSASSSPSPSSSEGGPFGPGCSSLPKDGPGSPQTMADQEVATAAAGNSELTRFTAALKKAGMADSLNSAKDITVFAPTNAAFDKLPQGQLDSLMNDQAKLKKLLEHHVVDKKVMRDELANGSFTAKDGGKLTTSGSGSDFKVDDKATITCGGIPTKNATVYLVDSVLMPAGGGSESPSPSESSPSTQPSETSQPTGTSQPSQPQQPSMSP